MSRAHTIIPSPHGDMLAIADDGALVRLHWIDEEQEKQEEEGGDEPRDSRRSSGPFRTPVRELDAYWAGRLRRFSVPIAPSGTPFQQEIWRALTKIPYGRTTSYSRLAASIGRPRAVRATGRANGANPIAILVPCHRVVGASGALTGYAARIERKAALLRLEGIAISGDSLENGSVATHA
jgi:methylated-DNA-[protein]-cysteine S-methyltransferase